MENASVARRAKSREKMRRLHPARSPSGPKKMEGRGEDGAGPLGMREGSVCGVRSLVGSVIESVRELLGYLKRIR